VAALALAASASGALVLPRFADADLPASMRARATPTPVQQKLLDDRCPNRHAVPGT
jgi:hypothetical protein